MRVPSKSGWSFEPPGRSYVPLVNPCFDQIFSSIYWATIYSLKGYVKDSSGKSISGVKVTLYGDIFNTYTTTENSYYEFANLPGKNYIITCEKKGYSFNPVTRTYSPLDSDKSGQDFIATASTIEIPEIGAVKLPEQGDIKFIGSATLKGTINPRGKYTLRIFTLLGELVYETTQDSNINTGYFVWLPKNIASGIYLLHIEEPGVKKYKKLAILR